MNHHFRNSVEVLEGMQGGKGGLIELFQLFSNHNANLWALKKKEGYAIYVVSWSPKIPHFLVLMLLYMFFSPSLLYFTCIGVLFVCVSLHFMCTVSIGRLLKKHQML